MGLCLWLCVPDVLRSICWCACSIQFFSSTPIVNALYKLLVCLHFFPCPATVSQQFFVSPLSSTPFVVEVCGRFSAVYAWTSFPWWIIVPSTRTYIIGVVDVEIKKPQKTRVLAVLSNAYLMFHFNLEIIYYLLIFSKIKKNETEVSCHHIPHFESSYSAYQPLTLWSKNRSVQTLQSIL